MKEPMKMKLAALILICTAAAAQAITMTFSGVVTDVTLENSDVSYWNIFAPVPVIGDPIHGQIGFASDRYHYNARIYVGGAIIYSDTFDDYWHSISPDGRTISFFPITNPWQGSDAVVDVSPTAFIAEALDLIGGSDNHPQLTVTGIVTRQTVTAPDTGSPILLLGVALAALVGFQINKQTMKGTNES